MKNYTNTVLSAVFMMVFGFVLVAGAVWNAPYAHAATPLLQAGKKTLYQRVVVHPGASLQSAAGAGTVVEKQVKPFSVYYVYAKSNGWLQVGPSSTEAIGWIEEAKATEWNQSMTLLFSDRTGRSPILFFKEEKPLIDICNAQDMAKRLTDLFFAMEKNRSGEAPADFPVLAAEPADDQGAVSRNRFYLMPIQQVNAPFEGTSFLRVASIDPGTAQPKKEGDGANGADGAGSGKPSADMSTGIVFVIDTTISMKPYIVQSLDVIRSAFDRIEKEKMGDNVGFAVVAFRNSTQGNAKLEYVTKVVSDFRTIKDRAELEAALAKVDEASASTHSYAEDSMAGVKAAVDSLTWTNYRSRVMVLITDAGPLPNSDPLASTRMGPMEMLDYAKAKQIWLTVCHVLSPSGAKDHASAEKAYRELSATSGKSSSYIAIPAPTPEKGVQAFATAAKTLAESFTKIVKATAEGKLAQKPKQEDSNKPLTPEEEAKRIAETIGYAMQLEFMGQQKGNRAPSVMSAWIADKDLLQLAVGNSVPTVEVAVLVTKNQLSDLQQQLKIIIDQAERTKKTDSKDFFQGILSASAQMARDPAQFSTQPGQNLQQMGVLSEFLEGLPYKSDIMLLEESDWYRMSVGEQTAFVNRLRSRIARYEEYDKDRSNWESFGAANAGDWVYRVPLSMLP